MHSDVKPGLLPQPLLELTLPLTYLHLPEISGNQMQSEIRVARTTCASISALKSSTSWRSPEIEKQLSSLWQEFDSHCFQNIICEINSWLYLTCLSHGFPCSTNKHELVSKTHRVLWQFGMLKNSNSPIIHQPGVRMVLIGHDRPQECDGMSGFTSCLAFIMHRKEHADLYPILRISLTLNPLVFYFLKH